jgi:hypothetical protein
LGLGGTNGTVREEGVPSIAGFGDDNIEVPTESLARLRNLRCSGVYWGPLVLVVNALAIELRFKCEKLTPRFPKVPGCTTTGGLLAQTELVMEERDMDLLCAVAER